MANNLFNDYLKNKKRSTSTSGSASSASGNTANYSGVNAAADYKSSANYKMREEQAAIYKAGARKRAYAKKKAKKEGHTWYPIYQKAGEGTQSLNRQVSYNDMMNDYLAARRNSNAPQPVVTGSRRYPAAGTAHTGTAEVNKMSASVPASIVKNVAATGDNNVARITRQYALAGSKAANPEITNLGDLRKDDYSFKTDNYAANRIAEEKRKAAARTSAAAAGELAAKHYVNQLNADKDAAEKRTAADVTQTALSDEAKKNLAAYIASGKKDETSFARPEKTLGVQDLTSDSYENTREYQAMQKLINPRKNNPNMSAMENAAYNTVHNMLGLPAAVGVEVGTSMASGMEGLANTAKGIVTGEKPSDNDLYGASQAAGFREGILRGVRDITGNEYDGVRTKREDITDFLTGVGLDMANSVARAHLLGAAGGSIQASGSAANDSYLDTAHDDSVSAGQANALAVVNAFNEGFFEHFSIENYLKMSPANSLKTFKQNLLKTMAVEGEEEGATEIGNIIGEMLILRDNSQYMQEYKNRIASGEDSRDALVNTVASAAGRIGQATVGGALSGVGSTGARQITGMFSNSMDFDNTWRNGQNPYAEIADSIDASTASGVDAKRAAEEYAERVKNGGSVSAIEKGFLQTAIDNAASESQRVEKHEEIAVNESLDEKTRATAAEYAEAARNGEEYSEEEDSFLRKANEEALEAAEAEPVEEEAAPEPAATGYGEKPEGISDALWREITAEPYNMLSNAERSEKLEHRAAEIGLVSQIRDMETKALDSWSKEYGTSGQQAFKDNFQAGMRTSDYVRAFNKIYDAGRYNVPIGNIDESYAALISNKDTFENIYKAGANDARTLYDEATKLSYHDRQEERIGGVLDAYRTVPEDVKSVFESLGKKTGIQFVLVDSRYDKGAGENALGSYRGDGIITVDVNPNQDGFNIMQTTSHEMTHWLQEYAPMEYEMFKEEAIRTIMKSSGTTLDEEIQKRRAAGYTGTREEITDEIVADSTGTFLNDADFAKNIAENQPKMATRIVEWLKSMVDALKTLVSTKNIRKAAAALKEDLNAYTSARDMWMIAVNEASEKMKTSAYAGAAGTRNQAMLHEDAVSQENFENNIEKVQKMDPIACNVTDEARKYMSLGSRQLRKDFLTRKYESFGVMHQENVGDIHFNRDSKKDEIGHGEQSLERTVAILNLPKIVENSRPVYYDFNHKGKTWDTVTLASRIRIGEDNYFALATVKVTSDRNTHRFVYTDADDVAVYAENKESGRITSRSVPSLIHDGSAKIAPALHMNDIFDILNDVNRTGENLINGSEERTLSTDQKRYFKNSKVRDDNGNLKVMYHGTPTGGFTVFRNGLEFFTDNKSYADNYQNESASSRGSGKGEAFPETYEVYLNITSPFDTRDPKIRKEFMNDYVKGGWALGIDPSDPSNAFMTSGLPSWEEADNIYEWMEENDLLDKYDGLILDEGAYQDEHGNPVPRGLSYVTFRPEQVKNVTNEHPTSDKDIRFQKVLKDNGVDTEETGSLVAVHNVNINKIGKMLDMPSLPMPSIAITKADMGWNDFGLVSFVFRKSTIDPKTDRRNRVYGADAWTPTFANLSIENEIDEDVRVNARAIIKKETEGKIPPYLASEATHFIDVRVNDIAENRTFDDLIDQATHDRGMQAAYIASKGETLSDNEKTVSEPTITEEKISFYKAMIREFGSELDGASKMPIKKILEDYGPRIQKVYKNHLIETGVDKATVEKRSDAFLNSKFGMGGYTGWRAVNAFTGAEKFKETGVQYKERTVRDEEATRDEIRKKLDKDGFKSWLEDLFSGIITGSGIRNNVDPYTPSGNRRSFAATHYSVTPENIVRAMVESRDGKSKAVTTPPGIRGIIAAGSNEFSSIEEIHNDEGRLQPKDAASNVDELETRLQEVEQKISDQGSYKSIDTIEDAIIEAAGKKRVTAAAIRKAFDWYGWIKYTESDVNEILDIIKEARQVPTDMFEAKPERTVDFSEVAHVLVPDGISEDILAKLADKGLDVVTYDSEVAGDRTEKLKALDGVRFQLGIDETATPAPVYAESEKLDQATEDLSKLIINARNVMPSSQKIMRLTSDLTKEWNSTMDRATIRQQIEKLYASMAVSENANGREFSDTAAAIGGEILDHAVIKDEEQEEKWSSFKKTLRNTIIYIPASNVHDIEAEGFNALRKRYFQKIQFTTDPKYMEHTGADVYRELKQQFPDYFTLNPDQMYDVDAVQEIMNVRDNGGPVLESGTPNNAQDYNETTYALGERILKTFFDEADQDTRKQYMDTYHSAVLDLRVASSRELKKTRAALETRYNRNLALLKKRYAANNLAIEDYIAEKAKLDEMLKAANLDRAAMAERLRKHKEDYVKRQRKATDIKRMESSMRKIQKMIEQPTDKNHVPAPLAKGIQQLFSTIDLTTDYKSGKANELRRKDYERLQSLDFTNALGDFKNVVNAVMKEEGILTDPETGINTRITLDPDFLTRLEDQEAYIEEMARSYKSIPKVRKMSYEKVHELYQLIQSIRKMLEYANRFTALDTSKTVEEFATRTMNELRDRRAEPSYSKDAPARKFVQSMLHSGMLDSPTFFNLIGGDGGTGDEMYAALRNGLDKKTVAVNESMKFIERAMKDLGISGKEVQEWSQKTRKVGISTQYVDATDAQLMELYVLNKREQARKHMHGNSANLESQRKNGGIQFEKVAGKDKKELNTAKATGRVTDSDIEAAIKLLSPKQKQLADRMQHFLATSVSSWGNETSMNLYGYEKFLERDYWPIRTASDYRATKTSDIERGMTTLANMGFTKATVDTAQSPLIIGNIFDTFTNHIDKMSSYNAFLPALEDMQKWLNYQDGYEAVKVMIRDGMSDDALEFLNNLVLDLNGSRGRADKWGNFTNIFLGKAKAVAVAWSPSVAIQQPFSIVRAAAEMDPKYIAAAMNPANLAKRKEAWEMAKKYAPIVTWKQIGGPDISTGRSLKNAIFGAAGKIDAINEAGMLGAEMGDRMTWTTLWQAAEEEVKDKKKDLLVGSPEYYAAVKKVFDHVIDFTQVVDSPLHRTEMMKSKSDFAKIATSFQSEPMKTYNMLYREIYKLKQNRFNSEGKKAVKKRIAQVAAVLAMNILVTNAAKSVMGALKDPDKEKPYGERWLDAFLDNIGIGGFVEALDPENKSPKKWEKAVLDLAGSDFSPIAYVPFISTILDQLNGYDSNIGSQSFSDLTTAADELVKILNGTQKEGVVGVIYKMSPALHMFGISSKNMLRWTGAVIDEVIMDAGFSDAEYVRNRLMLSIKNDQNTKTFVAEAMKEYARGNKDLGDKIMQDLIKAGIDEKKINDKIGTMLAAEPELELAARSYVNGAKEDYDSLRQQLIQKGYSEELVDKKLKSAVEKLAPASRADIATAIYEGNDKETIDAYIKYMRSLGKEDKDIRSDIKSGMTSKYKAIYKSSDRATQRKIEQRLETVQVLKENIYTTQDFYYTGKDGSVDRSKGLKWEK